MHLVFNYYKILQLKIISGYAPEVIEEEFNPIVRAGEGDYVTLKCAIRGNPKPVFTWSKDNVMVIIS